MGILTEDMKRVVREVGLGFHATVNEDGSPNLSPKGTTGVWDDDHLFFADIRSPQTVANIRRGSLVEVNVVDPFVRKGYRFTYRSCRPPTTTEEGARPRSRDLGKNAMSVCIQGRGPSRCRVQEVRPRR
jgi:predicted pyridoxine 5'-phosphate oxidase superfamily flavin-nucleotide-binding protein